MKYSTKPLRALAGAFIAIGALAGSSNAAVIINMLEDGPNVVATGSGSFNLTALTAATTAGAGGIDPGTAFLEIGGLTAPFTVYTTIAGPTSFGTGGFAFSDSNTGDRFGRRGTQLTVPEGYVSGDPLAGSATFNGKTFATLGVTPGSYVWTWGSGADADSLTINVGAVIPEPSSALLLGLASLGLVARRRRNR